MICDNHEENGLIGDVRRRALTVVGSFSRADRRHQHPTGCSHHSICSFPRDSLFFLPRPHNMAKTVRPLRVNGLTLSVAREFDERIDTRQSTIAVQPALIHSIYPSI
jgi:hypothetical protein